MGTQTFPECLHKWIIKKQPESLTTDPKNCLTTQRKGKGDHLIFCLTIEASATSHDMCS